MWHFEKSGEPGAKYIPAHSSDTLQSSLLLKAENTMSACFKVSAWDGVVSSFTWCTVFVFIISTLLSLPALMLSLMKWRQLSSWVRVVSIWSLWAARPTPSGFVKVANELSLPSSEDLPESSEGDVYVVFDSCSLVGYLSTTLLYQCQCFLDGRHLLLHWLQWWRDLYSLYFSKATFSSS